MRKDLYDEVIGIHDEVMPKMSNLLALERQLMERIEQLDSTKAGDIDKAGKFKDQISNLQEADEAMMQWMRNFQVDQEGWSHDSVMSYLSDEKERISIVREKMLNVILETEKLLEGPDTN